VVLALAAQEDLLIVRADPNRAACQAELDKFEAAEKLAEKDPAGAIKALSEILEKPRLLPETRVRIERRANDPDPPRLFTPFQLRGRVRLTLARAEGVVPAERRRMLHDAVVDLEESVRRRAASSEPYAREARTELWSAIRTALAFGAAEPATLDLGAQANALLAKMGDEAKDAASWLEGEVERAAAAVKALEKKAGSRDVAVRLVGWCDAALAAAKGIARLKPAAASAARVRSAALAAADYTGAFRLKVCVSPYAEIESIAGRGKDVKLASRYTPLAVPDSLEIGEYKVKLLHPRLGKREYDLAGGGLKDGATYVLSGDMETGRFTLTELP